MEVSDQFHAPVVFTTGESALPPHTLSPVPTELAAGRFGDDNRCFCQEW